MNKYNFYYDESEHSRKINLKTVTANNYYDNFVTAIVGWKSGDAGDAADLSIRYQAFEEKYSARKSKGELKSETIKQNQLKNGFASLNNQNSSFLDDLFSLFDEKVLIYFSVISKTEYVINQLFGDYKNSLHIDMDAMKYSIIKAIILYQPKEIIDGMYENTNDLIKLLKNFFYAKIEENKRNEVLKEKENEQFAQIIMLLDDISVISTIDWDYDISFIGFKKYLDEMSINHYSLTIDKEGEKGNTAKAAEHVGLNNVTEVNSLDCFGIRMADMLAGIISKLLKSLHNALGYTSPDEHIQKKLLDKSWFAINERQLALYKKMHYVVVELNKAWYKAFAGVYSDDLIVLISLLQFMNHFNSPKEIKQNIEMQGEYFNAHACASLSDYYNRMRNKLPIDHIGNMSSEYFLNQRGAKVYFDVNKQPKLEISDGERLCDVMSVGFSREMIPLITISDLGEAKCYKLPIELADWATTLVGFANMGENLFPAKVIFHKTKDGYYADII